MIAGAHASLARLRQPGEAPEAIAGAHASLARLRQPGEAPEAIAGAHASLARLRQPGEAPEAIAGAHASLARLRQSRPGPSVHRAIAVRKSLTNVNPIYFSRALRRGALWACGLRASGASGFLFW